MRNGKARGSLARPYRAHALRGTPTAFQAIARPTHGTGAAGVLVVVAWFDPAIRAGHTRARVPSAAALAHFTMRASRTSGAAGVVTRVALVLPHRTRLKAAS